MYQEKVLIVDHHDSFIYNLRQIIDETKGFVPVVLSIDEVVDVEGLLRQYRYILLSPGPGHPDEYPAMYELIRGATDGTHTILGVCLGMQGLWCCFGGKLTNLSAPKHGHRSELRLLRHDALLFKEIEMPTPIARYHSWVVDPDTQPDDWWIDALDEEGEVMAISHKKLPFYAVQFHPESIISECGRTMVHNWLQTET